MTKESPYRLDGQIALISGGGQGLGEAIARVFAENGATVVIAGRTLEKLVRVCNEIQRDGYTAFPVQADVGLPQSIDALHKTIRRELGQPVTILVNNAGIIAAEPFMDITWESWQSILTTNLTGAFYCSQVFASDMMEAGFGSIIMHSSVNGLAAEPSAAHYNASKAGMILLAKSMALELAPHHIRVNTIATGQIATPLTLTDSSLEITQGITEKIPLKRWGSPEEIAHVALFLASKASSYVTGAVVVADGGLLCHY